MLENAHTPPGILATVLSSAPHSSLDRVLPVLNEESGHWTRIAALMETMPLPESASDFDALCDSFLHQEKAYAALRTRFEEHFRAATAPAEQDTLEAVYNGLTDICVALRDLRFNMIVRHCENAPPQEPVFVARNKEDIRKFFKVVRAKAQA
jgi:hypothetical protein